VSTEFTREKNDFAGTTMVLELDHRPLRVEEPLKELFRTHGYASRVSLFVMKRYTGAKPVTKPLLVGEEDTLGVPRGTQSHVPRSKLWSSMRLVVSRRNRLLSGRNLGIRPKQEFIITAKRHDALLICVSRTECTPLKD
jgi:hypothetical protein